MKKHSVIYLFVMLLASSCGNSVIDDVNDGTSENELRSASLYTGNTLFLDAVYYYKITPLPDQPGTEYRGDTEVTAKIYSQYGATYSFICATNSADGAKYAIRFDWDYNVISNGYGEFTVHVAAGKTLTVKSSIEFSKPGGVAPIIGESRLLITKINGIGITDSEPGFCDIIALSEAPRATDGGGGSSSDPYHWKCNICGFLNTFSGGGGCTFCN